MLLKQKCLSLCHKIINKSPCFCLSGWYTWISMGRCVVLSSTVKFSPVYLLHFSIVRWFQSVQYNQFSNTAMANGWGTLLRTRCRLLPSALANLEIVKNHSVRNSMYKIIYYISVTHVRQSDNLQGISLKGCQYPLSYWLTSLASAISFNYFVILKANHMFFSLVT